MIDRRKVSSISHFDRFRRQICQRQSNLVVVERSTNRKDLLQRSWSSDRMEHGTHLASEIPSNESIVRFLLSSFRFSWQNMQVHSLSICCSTFDRRSCTARRRNRVQWSYRLSLLMQQENRSVVSVRTDSFSLGAICWTFHYSKRILETLFVHRFSHATMPLFNLFKVCLLNLFESRMLYLFFRSIKNCGYYWTFTAMVSYFVNHPKYSVPSYGSVQIYAGLILFLVEFDQTMFFVVFTDSFFG